MLQYYALTDLLSMQRRKLSETKDDGEPPSIAMQSPQQLADYLSSMQAKAFPEKSGLELLDLSIPGESSAWHRHPVDFNSTVRQKPQLWTRVHGWNRGHWTVWLSSSQMVQLLTTF